MQSIQLVYTLWIVTIIITWITDTKTSAFTLSTGSCNAGISSIENSISGNIHIGGVRSTLAEVASTLSIQGVEVDPETTMIIPMNTDVTWEVEAFNFEYKGIFVRVAASSDDFILEQSENITLQRVDLCDAIPGVAGLSHRNGTLKSSSSGTMYFATAGTAIVDVTLVYGISESSLYAWSSFALRIEASTDTPTNVPLIAPTVTTTNEPITSPVKIPTEPPTQKPTKKPTGVPSVMPSKAMTGAPITETVETENIKVAIDNIQIIFGGVGTIPAADLLLLQTTMENWYEDYFNVEMNATEQRRHLHESTSLHRQLQQYRVPAVRNMKTIIAVTTQDTSSTSGSNTMIYSQNLLYDVTNDARAPADYALLPYVDTSYKNQLMEKLKTNVGSMTDLTAISTPDITEPPTNMEESSDSNGNDGVSLPVIISIVAGVVIALLLGVIGIGYSIHQRKMNHQRATTTTVTTGTTTTTKTVTRDNSDIGEPRPETVNNTDNPDSGNTTTTNNNNGTIPTAAITWPVVAQTVTTSTDPPPKSASAAAANGYFVTYKDQSRDVTGMMTSSTTTMTPIAQAIPYPKVQMAEVE